MHLSKHMYFSSYYRMMPGFQVYKSGCLTIRFPGCLTAAGVHRSECGVVGMCKLVLTRGKMTPSPHWVPRHSTGHFWVQPSPFSSKVSLFLLEMHKNTHLVVLELQKCGRFVPSSIFQCKNM